MVRRHGLVLGTLLGLSLTACSHHAPQAVAGATPGCSGKTLVVTNNLSRSFPVYWLAPGASATTSGSQHGRTLLGTAQIGTSRFPIPTADGAGQPQLWIEHAGPINAQEASYRIECAGA